MNTYLHIIEAYTEFYRVTKDAEIASKLRSAIDKFAEKIYNPVLRREEVFFDRAFHSMIDLHSYGHDIEASWLIDRALNVLNDAAYRDRIGIITTNLAEEVFKDAYREHSLVAECENGIVNTMRGWWCQCEAMIGFYNEYQKSGREEFAEASYQIWQYIYTYIDDKREESEWYAEVDALGNPNTEKPIVDEWKCPYHVGRLFFEMINRLTSTTK
jgi:mannobiose 2-epimerase